MSGKIVDVRKLADNVKKELREKIEEVEKVKGVKLTLAVIMVGSSSASSSYTKKIEALCTETGMNLEKHILNDDITEEDFIEYIMDLNYNDDVHGILLQVPIPGHLNENKAARAILPGKDVDCFNPESSGRLFRGDKCLLPCTPKGVMRILKDCSIELSGTRVAVVGRGNVVGKPVSILLLNEGSTVTICHSKTSNIEEVLSECDVVISAAGVKGLIKGNMIKPGAVVIDVGVSSTGHGIAGDVEFESVIEKASYVTTVPGGVGEMTTIMLIENVLEASGYYE